MLQGKPSTWMERFVVARRHWLPRIHSGMFGLFREMIVALLLRPVLGDKADLFSYFTLAANFLRWGV